MQVHRFPLRLVLPLARELNNADNSVVAIIGDGALTGGLAYEALNNAGSLDKDILVVLNDNQMSISPNVGAVSRMLTDITTSPRYNRAKDEIWHLTEKMPFRQATPAQICAAN